MNLPFFGRNTASRVLAIAEEAHRREEFVESALRSYRRAFEAEHRRRLQAEREVAFRDECIRKALALPCFDGVRSGE